MNNHRDEIKHWEDMRRTTKWLNKKESRRGVLLYMPGVTEDEAHSPLISAERHARVPSFQYFLRYFRATKEDENI